MVATTRSKRTAATTPATARKARATASRTTKPVSAAPAVKTNNGIQKFTRTVKAGSAASSLPSKAQNAKGKSERQVQCLHKKDTKEKPKDEVSQPSPPAEAKNEKPQASPQVKSPDGQSNTTPLGPPTAKPKPLAPSKKSPLQPQTRPTKPNPKTKTSTTETRKSSLLVRLLEKQAQLASQPPPPTKAEKLKIAAEQRVPEILSVLSLMKPQPPPPQKNRKTAAPSRRPYSFDVVVQNVQQSARSPVEKDVVIACLDIIAKSESGGKWVDIVTVNQVKSIVLTTHPS